MKSQDPQCCQRRAQLWQDDAPVDLPFTRTVNSGGIHQFGGQCLAKLAHHEDAKGIHRAEDDQSPQRVDQPQLGKDQVAGDHGDLRGDHHHGQEPAEEDLLAREFELGEHVADQRAGEERGCNIEDGNEMRCCRKSAAGVIWDR